MSPDLSRHFAVVGADPLAHAFSARRAVMPFRGKTRIAPDLAEDQYQAVLSRKTARGGRLAYVHVPFCANHCLFCGFYANAYTPDAGAAYVDLVIRDIEREAQSANVRDGRIDAVYLGGGTPTALSAKELSRLLGVLRRNLPLSADCEITVEGRIIHFDEDKIDACIEAGANRFSIGIQSFDTHVRKRLGRRSDKAQAIAFLEMLNGKSCVASVIDLMYGLPNQTLDVWQEDLAIAAAIAPDGLDIYGLNLIPGTPLAKAIEAGKFAVAPTLAERGAYYDAGVRLFRSKGWTQISNNHFAATALERNRYNRMTKEGAECLAFGAGAGGSLGDLGFGNISGLEAFGARIDEDRKPLGMVLQSDRLQPLRNFVAGSLEVGQLDLGELDRRAGHDLGAVLRPLVEQWQDAGLLTIAAGRCALGIAGRFWYSNLISALYEVIDTELAPHEDMDPIQHKGKDHDHSHRRPAPENHPVAG